MVVYRNKCNSYISLDRTLDRIDRIDRIDRMNINRNYLQEIEEINREYNDANRKIIIWSCAMMFNRISLVALIYITRT